MKRKIFGIAILFFNVLFSNWIIKQYLNIYPSKDDGLAYRILSLSLNGGLFFVFFFNDFRIYNKFITGFLCGILSYMVLVVLYYMMNILSNGKIDIGDATSINSDHFIASVILLIIGLYLNSFSNLRRR